MFPNLCLGESKELRGHRDKVHTIGWNLDGKKLASGSTDQTARIWHPERLHKSSIELRGHTGDVDQLVWDPTHTDRLCTASLDKTVRCWDIRVPQIPAHVIKTPGENINICWSFDGHSIAVGNKEDTIVFIDMRGGLNKTPMIYKTLKMNLEINEMSWDYTGKFFYMTTGKGTVQIFSFPALECVHEIHAHTSNIYCFDLDPKGRYFALGGADALASIWDLNDLMCTRTLSKLDWPVRTISLSFDGEFIASGSEETNIDIASFFFYYKNLFNG